MSSSSAAELPLAGRRFVILGGGTAGWMAANLLLHHWGGAGIEVVVIDSSRIGIIGVGEGSTPQIKRFFETIGLAEEEWMPRCQATYKNGIRFAGWSDQSGHEGYFHPFPSNLDDRTQPAYFLNSYLRRRGYDVAAHPDRFFLAAYLARECLAPLPARNFPFVQLYGYHFDASLLGGVLREHAIGRGARHIDCEIDEVVLAEDGNIAELRGAHGVTIDGDFFLDATGFRSLLLQQALGVPFVSFAANLFNDRAVALAAPREAGGRIQSQTLSIAMPHGWRWVIPLTRRHGNGYVYSSHYCTADEAETALRRELGLLDSEVAARHLQMKVGRVAEHWRANCLAVGLAQGFIEPLEATALHLVQETVERFIAAYPSPDGERARRAFNNEINARFEGVRDYIVAHYRMSRRSDNDYWRDNTSHEQVSESLDGVLRCWFGGGDLGKEIERQNIARYYTATSWHCLLGGYGHFPKPQHAAGDVAPDQAVDLSRIDDFLSRCALNFPDHAAAVAVKREGLASCH